MKLLSAAFVLFVFSSLSVSGAGNDDKDKNLTLFGDARIRAEMDMNSSNADGTVRRDRDRLRFRLRFGFRWQHSDHFAFGGRLRSGAVQSAQSPHSTLGDGFAPKTMNIDKAYIKGDYGHGFYWFGKNTFHFWKQNEMFWDDDVTPEGGAISHTVQIENGGSLTANGGIFFIDATSASQRFSDQAKMIGAQIAFKTKFSDIPFESAVGYYSFRANKNSSSILSGKDSKILVAGASLTFNSLSFPVKIGVDYMNNLQDYAGRFLHDDQTKGYTASVRAGRLKKKGSVYCAYYFAHIEEHAVVTLFAQDDWLRWGSATTARSSNFGGHEFRVAYAMDAGNSLVLRFYLVEALELRSRSAKKKETGTRVRLDWNMKF